MKKIVFFLASLSQPRCIKRVKALHEAGFEVEVYGYYRGFYDINSFPEGIEVQQWGEVKSGTGYIKKFLKNKVNINEVLRKKKSEEVLYYAFGFDLALCLSMHKHIHFVYESSDLIYTYFRNKILIDIFKYIDKKIIARSFKTIFTSKGFQRYLYGEKKVDNIIIQPNRVSPFFNNVCRRVLSLKEQDGIVFSYVGAFRYPNTVFRFARIIGEKYPQHKFYFYGDSLLTYMAKDLAEKYSNIRYFGKFRSPEDLEKIYNTIDVVIACYDANGINEQIAEPNKLYEAICFCKPIVVSEGTFLSEQVKNMRVGYSIKADNDNSITDFLNHLNYRDLVYFSENELCIDKTEYIDSIDIISKDLFTFYK